mmetsp:Transcript_43854/g.98652  ORF Transcript_43854/g.98652 Transcript_43854/m.98652 type:complete len:90 (+) Transcript_43854:144-413(+)
MDLPYYYIVPVSLCLESKSPLLIFFDLLLGNHLFTHNNEFPVETKTYSTALVVLMMVITKQLTWLLLVLLMMMVINGELCHSQVVDGIF